MRLISAMYQVLLFFNNEGLGYPRFNSRLQQVFFLYFVACSIRQVGAKFNQPCEGNRYYCLEATRGAST